MSDFKFETENYWMPTYNMLEEVLGDYRPPKKVMVMDCTIREGEQTPGVVFTPEEKIEIATELGALGVGAMQFALPTTPAESEVVEEIKRRVPNMEIWMGGRANKKDIDTIAATGVQYLGIENPGNPFAANVLLKKDYYAALANTCECIKYAKSLGLTVSTGGWDMARMELDDLKRSLCMVAEAGVDRTGFGDTFGFIHPFAAAWIFKQIRSWLGPDIRLNTHFHNDFGMATANTLGAVLGGADIVHGTINGLGERVGNASIDELAVALELTLGVDTGIRLDRLYHISRKVSSISKEPVSPSKPIVGDRMFTLGSGMVVDLFEKYKQTDRPTACFAFNPAMVGRGPGKVVYGKGVGGNMVRALLREKGYNDFTPEQVGEIVRTIKDESEHWKNILPDDVVENIVRCVMEKRDHGGE